METKLDGVTEYCEERPVELAKTTGKHMCNIPNDLQPGYGRLVIRATNEGGHNSTEVDLLELIAWLKANRPELLA